MNLILTFLVAHLSFLWAGARFQIGDSRVTTSNGGNAHLTLTSELVRLRFVCDRQQLTLELQPTAMPESLWFPLGLLEEYVLGRPVDSGLLGADQAEFLRDHLAEIESRFSTARWPETRKELVSLAAQRSRRTRDRYREG